MIEFKNKAVKIIFYAVFALLILFSLFMIITTFINPSHYSGLFYLIFILFSCLLLPSLLMIFFFTNATPHKKRTEKMVRSAKWIPISTFLVLSVVATVLMIIQSGDRCANVGPEGKLWECDFTRTDLSNMNLQKSEMMGINLNSANLSGSNLIGANLTGADLSNSTLAGADLSDANLYVAKLDGADLTNTVLDGASLSEASLIDVTGLTNESLANLSKWEGMLLQSEDQIIDELGQVCKGIGLENSASYDSEQGATSIIAITDKGEKYRNSGYFPRNWWPASVSNAELVACVKGPYNVTIETCTYDDGTIMKRISKRIDISIFVARTGEQLEMITLEGPPPTHCSQQVVSATSDEYENYGDAPTGSQVIEALTPFAHDGGDLHPPRIP